MQKQRYWGTEQVIVLRLVNNQLPELLAIKAHVDAGLCLHDGELEYMARILLQVRRISATAEQFPELKTLVAKLVDLNGRIVEQALENEAS